MKKNLNQKLLNLVEYYNLINANLLLNNVPLKRNVNNINAISGETKLNKLEMLKKKVKTYKKL